MDKYRRTVPVDLTFKVGETVTSDKETAIVQLLNNAVRVLNKKIGDLRGEESLYPASASPKFIPNIAQAIGDMSKLEPPLNKTKAMLYAPYLYRNLKDAGYNVLPNPEQAETGKLCSVGCIYDHYTPGSGTTESCEKYATDPSVLAYYRKINNTATAGICQNQNCPYFSGKPTVVSGDKVRQYKIVFPEETRLVDSFDVFYYENCGTSFGEQERTDNATATEWDGILPNGDPFVPSDTYAYHTGEPVVYKFQRMKETADITYHVVFEIPNLGVNVKVSAGSSEVGVVEISDSPFAAGLYYYELAPSEYHNGTLYLTFEQDGTANGGVVSRIYIIEQGKKRHFNYGEQLFLPVSLGSTNVGSVYPSGAVNLFDTVANVTIDHIDAKAAYFRYFEDPTQIHRDCVDVVTYNDTPLVVGNNRYVVYTAGLSLAEAAGALMEELFNHVGNENIHLTAEDVCNIINDPTPCCVYKDIDATVTCLGSYGLKIDGLSALDSYKIGDFLTLNPRLIGDYDGLNISYKWTITNPNGDSEEINTQVLFYQLQPYQTDGGISDTAGTWHFRIDAQTELNGTLYTSGASEEFSLFVAEGDDTITATISLNATQPGDVYRLNDGFAFIGATADELVLDYDINALLAVGDFTLTAYAVTDSTVETEMTTFTGPVSTTGSVTIDFTLGAATSGYVYAVVLNDSEEEVARSNHIHFNTALDAEVLTSDYSFNPIVGRHCNIGGATRYPIKIGNIRHANVTADYLGCGISYWDTVNPYDNLDYRYEYVFQPVFGIQVSDMDALVADDIEYAFLLLYVTNVSGGGTWSTALDASNKYCLVDMFDYDLFSIASNESRLGLTVENVNGTRLGAMMLHDGRYYMTNGCEFSSLPTSTAQVIPTPDEMSALSLGQSYARAFNLYPIKHDEEGCSLPSCCGYSLTGSPASLRTFGSYGYSLATLRPPRYASGEVDEEQFGGPPQGTGNFAYINSPSTHANQTTKLYLPLESGTIQERSWAYADITIPLKNMLTQYHAYEQYYNVPRGIGFRIQHRFPNNTSTQEDRFVVFDNAATITDSRFKPFLFIGRD